jgi:hypothetical protein
MHHKVLSVCSEFWDLLRECNDYLCHCWCCNYFWHSKYRHVRYIHHEVHCCHKRKGNHNAPQNIAATEDEYKFKVMLSHHSLQPAYNMISV